MENTNAMPVPVAQAPFAASGREVAWAITSIIGTFAAVRVGMIGLAAGSYAIMADCALYAAMVFWLNRGTPITADSVMCLTCFLLTGWGLCFGSMSVWPALIMWVFLVGFGSLLAMVRAGALLDGRLSRMLAVDGLLGGVVTPVVNLFLRARCLMFAHKARVTRREKHITPAALGWGLLGAGLCAALLMFGWNLLTAADDGFAAFAHGLLRPVDTGWMGQWVAALMISLPVGAWQFALAAGNQRRDRAQMDMDWRSVDSFLGRLAKVPWGVWVAAVGAFSVMYGAFFAIQAGYLFGAFTRTLPEGFIVSQYARQGFFELCQVMGLNFLLMWLARRMTTRSCKPLRAACLVLVAESVVFALVALSKLWLYIDCFGFTPLRLQSCWLVCSLLVGCVCAAVGLVTGRSMTRWWIYFSCVTLAGLCVV